MYVHFRNNLIPIFVFLNSIFHNFKLSSDTGYNSWDARFIFKHPSLTKLLGHLQNVSWKIHLILLICQKTKQTTKKNNRISIDIDFSLPDQTFCFKETKSSNGEKDFFVFYKLIFKQRPGLAIHETGIYFYWTGFSEEEKCHR